MFPTNQLPTSTLLSPSNLLQNVECPTPHFRPQMFSPPLPTATDGTDQPNQTPSVLNTAAIQSEVAVFEIKNRWNEVGKIQHRLPELQPICSNSSPKVKPSTVKSLERNNQPKTSSTNHPSSPLPDSNENPPLRESMTVSLPKQPTKKKRKRPQTPEYLPCHVCGDKAGKHSYYGGQACSSCRVFFRRAVESDYRLSYFCIKNKECRIHLKSRKKCQYCRYQACLAAGMKANWVMNEEQKKRFLDNRNKNKRPETVLKEPAPPLPLRPKNLISDEEMFEVKQYVKTSGYFDNSKVKSMETGLVREIVR